MRGVSKADRGWLRFQYSGKAFNSFFERDSVNSALVDRGEVPLLGVLQHA